MAKIPPKAEDALRKLEALTTDELKKAPSKASELASVALAAVGYPDKEHPIPLAEELSTEQRAVAERIAPLGWFGVGRWAMPMENWVRTRWLGLEPAGVLEKKIGKKPRWRALADSGEDALSGLSPRERADAVAQIMMGAYASPFLNAAELDAGELDAAWGEETADWILRVVQNGGFFGSELPNRLCSAALVTIARGGKPIEPRWDELLFVFATRTTSDILKRIPEPRRGRAIVHALEHHFDSGKADIGLWLLERFPSAPLVKLVLEHCGSSHRQTKRAILRQLDAIGTKHDVVKRAMVAYKGKQPKAIHLHKKRVIDAPEKLTATQRAQIVAAGELYDQKELSADERLAMFGDTLSIHEITDAEGERAYDVFMYMADDGAVFTAETTDVVAWYVQSGLECDDEALYEALQDAMKQRVR